MGIVQDITLIPCHIFSPTRLSITTLIRAARIRRQTTTSSGKENEHSTAHISQIPNVICTATAKPHRQTGKRRMSVRLILKSSNEAALSSTEDRAGTMLDGNPQYTNGCKSKMPMISVAMSTSTEMMMPTTAKM
jgi:hypothetical protein